MEKQYAKDFLKKYITVIGGPEAIDALDDNNDKAAKAKEFVKKYFTVVGGTEAIDAAAKSEQVGGETTVDENTEETVNENTKESVVEPSGEPVEQ